MAFPVKDWKDFPDITTPIRATSLKDLETRLSGYTDAQVTDLSTAVTGSQAAQDTAINDVVTDVAVVKEAGLNVEWPEYGADPARTAAQNKVSIQAAIDALPVNGGTIILPRSYPVEPFSVAGRRSVILKGAGGLSAGAQARSQLSVAGAAGTSLLNMQGSLGCRLEDVQLLYSNAGFTGSPVDAQDSAFCGIERCYIGGAGGAASALGVVKTKNSQGLSIRDTVLSSAQHGVIGKELTGDFVTALSMDNVTFTGMTVANVRNPHHGWTLKSCIHQQLVSGNAGGIYSDFPVYGLTVLGGWMGDANALGDWINVFGYGVYILGTIIGAGLCGVRTDNGDIVGARISAQFEFCQFGYIADTGGGHLLDDIDTSGSSFNGIAAANRVVMGAAHTAAPTTGNHHRGEIRWKSDPSASGKIGWVCTASGTPGTWKAFGAIDA
jgi:hypothetical protein